MADDTDGHAARRSAARRGVLGGLAGALIMLLAASAFAATGNGLGFLGLTGDESGSVMDHARAKLARKGCDLLVVNDVGGGAVFGSEDNEAVVLAADGSSVSVPLGSKAALAHVIWDRVLASRAGAPDTP